MLLLRKPSMIFWRQSFEDKKKKKKYMRFWKKEQEEQKHEGAA